MDSLPSNSNTTTTPRPTPYEKSAEFARLYYFFEKLTQPRSRATSRNHHHRSLSHWHEEPETTAADAPIPEDIAPLLKNLSAILTKDEPLDHGDGGDGDGGAELLEASETQVCIPETPTTAMASTFATTITNTTTTTHFHHARSVSPSDRASVRPRRNTVAASAPASGSARTQTQTRFPLREKRYPFTFKLLLHKLYDLEAWHAKVQEVLAASQEQFRSLNATASPTSHDNNNNSIINNDDNTGSGGTSGGDGGGVPCSPASPGTTTTTFSGSLFGPASPPTSLESPLARRRRRAQSTSKTKASNDARGGPSTSSSTPPRPSRAVKKRIVNRRRSANRLDGEDVAGKMGEWMYDAAVSSVDAEQVDVTGKGDSLRRRKRVLSSVGFAEEERRFAGRDVTNVSF
jgi:hypothetical protein